MHGEPSTVIAPLAGRLVVFDSRLPHEVLPTHARRQVHTLCMPASILEGMVSPTAA